MSHLRLRIRLNKGKRGIPLDKLEHFVAASRKFLVSASRDLNIPSPDGWAAVDFRNGSIEWTNESGTEVVSSLIGIFNSAVIELSSGQPSRYIEPDTSANWAAMFEPLEVREQIGIAIYSESSNRAKWLKVTREIALLSVANPGLAVRESIGAIQGTVHAWYREAEPSYFTLRESSSRTLIKCFYSKSDYESVVLAVKDQSQVVHVHGRIYTDTVQRCIREILADRIVPAEPFTFSDFDRIWSQGKAQ